MIEDGSDRRRFLAATASVSTAVALAGCQYIGSNDDGESGDNDEGSGDNGSDVSGGSDDSGTGTDGGTENDSDAGDDGGSGDDGEAEEDISFEAPHGATIEATRYGDGDCGVVLVPQINKDRGSWQTQAETIADLGHLALAIDEDPDNRPSSVRGAISYFRAEHDVSTVALVGASSGGEAVVKANAETDESVAGTMTLSAAGGADRAPELQGRSVFVVASDDDEEFVQTARDLHENAPEPKALVEYEGSAHGQGLFESDHGDDLRDRFETFVDEVCGT